MSQRRSIHVAGVSHVNPIPSACRRGPFLVSGGISGNAADGALPAELEAQCVNMFENVRRVLEAAGARPEDVIKMTVWMKDRGARAAVNRQWVAMFPDPASRPARHTFEYQAFAAPMQIQCDILAVIEPDPIAAPAQHAG